MKKRILGILLAVCLIAQGMPVIAAEIQENQSKAENVTEAEEEVPAETPEVKETAEPASETSSVKETEIPAEEPTEMPKEEAGVIPSSSATPAVEPEAENNEVLTATEGLPKIDAPSAAWWDKDTGDMKWNPSVNGTGEYVIFVYREGETEEFYHLRYSLDVCIEAIFSGLLEYMTTGKYYFTVYAIGNEEYGDSDICKSDTLDYVRPDRKVAAPTDLKWNESTAMWNLTEGTSVAYELQCRLEGESEFRNVTTSEFYRRSQNAILSTSFLRYMNEKGVYRFRLKALSGNIFEAVDSDWSDWSPEISTDSFVSGVADELTDLIGKNAGADELLDCLDKKDTGQLAISMQTDEEVRAAVINAEQKFAQEKGITVESDIAADMKGKISGDVSIIGAAFNAGTNVSKITLKLSKPTVEKEISRQQYKNAVQVSMTLEGAADTENLKVPVRITMPVPAGIEASDLQILHYHNDGTIETIWPYISGNTASFTLTSFSTFVFVNRADGALPFTDVETNKWSYAGIKFAYEKGIMTGVEKNLFQPNVPLTRGMFASIIYRLAGAPDVSYKSIFSDVPAGKWYSNAIIWAYENKIVAGLGNGKYGVNDNITREQMARMLMEYAKVQGYDTSGRTDFNKFADASAVSGWAAENMSWAVEGGIISGSVKDGKYYMNPKGQATRAEAATMLMKFIQKYE